MNDLIRTSHYLLPLEQDIVVFVADLLLKRSTNSADRSGPADFSDTVVCFPGKRPALYLRRHLAQRIAAPFFPPRILDADALMDDILISNGVFTERTIVDDLDLLRLLYVVVQDSLKDASNNRSWCSNFNDFFFWGLKLLSAFDLLGTELVDPDALKRQVGHVVSMEGIHPQVAGIWSNLPTLYRSFVRELESRGIWTRGDIYRKAAELVRSDIFSDRDNNYIIAGFFALNRAQKQVFSSMCDRGVASVVLQGGQIPGFPELDSRWNQIDEIMSLCKGEWTEIPRDPEHTSPEVKLYRGFDVHSQIQIASDILSMPPDNIDPTAQALVIPRPDLLLPVLSWVLEDVDFPYNISMGYPLARTPIAQLLELVFKAQEAKQRYYVPDYFSVISHPYILPILTGDIQTERGVLSILREAVSQKASSFMELSLTEATVSGLDDRTLEDRLLLIHKHCFRSFEQAGDIVGVANAVRDLVEMLVEYSPFARHPLASEFISSILDMCRVIQEPDDRLSSDFDGLWSGEKDGARAGRWLFKYLIKERRIPFSGIPLDGIQVLGILETRCLNLKKVVVLEVNEGILPPLSYPDEILPPVIRKYLGLPELDYDAIVSRYHFFRLIAGSEEIDLIYAEAQDQMRSRFIEELVWAREKQNSEIDCVPVSEPDLSVNISLPHVVDIPKNDRILSVLKDIVLSPSAIDCFMGCPFMFYARYILRLSAREEESWEINPARIGILVHRVLQLLYARWLDSKRLFEPPVDELVVGQILDSVMEEYFGEKSGWSVKIRLLRTILSTKLQQFLQIDQELSDGCRVVWLEKKLTADRIVGNRKIQLGGKLDRLDILPTGQIRIIDYKTGLPKKAVNIKKISGDLDRKLLYQHVRTFQPLVYSYLVKSQKKVPYYRGEELGWSDIEVGFYYLKENLSASGKRVYVPAFTLKDRKDDADPDVAEIDCLFEDVLMRNLDSLLSQIFDPDEPFSTDPASPDICRICEYSSSICPKG